VKKSDFNEDLKTFKLSKMKTLQKITVNVFNTDHTNTKNYINSFEMPKYKQTKRIIEFLKKYVKNQQSNDFNHLTIRYYVFQSNAFLLKENDLKNYTN